MNKSKNWQKNKRRGAESQIVGKGRRNDRRSYNNRQNDYTRTEGRERRFQKFVDTDYINNESNYWPQNDWNNDNNVNNYFCNGSATEAGIFPWIRRNPVKPLIIPKHINFEQQSDREHLVNDSGNSKEINVQNGQDQVNKPTIPQEYDREKAVSRSRNNSVSSANHGAEDNKISKLTDQTNAILKVKQEKDVKLNLKQERKSSSSSSSSESSSSEEELELKNKTIANKPDVSTSSKPPSSPLNIKLKPKSSSVNSTPTKSLGKVLEPPSKASASSSSDEESKPKSSSISSTKTKTTKSLVEVQEPPSNSSATSSSDGESSPSPATSKVAAKKEKTEKLQVLKKELKNKSNKNSSEDDVVCIGNLESKIILEDESDKEDIEDEETLENTVNKKSKGSKKTSEQCMICDKKGHTSFQCQMICKNCSAPYHGYRTCPQPANLNTMLQLFIEFCMQQIQNFNAKKQLSTNLCEAPTKQTVNSLHSVSVNNKSNKVKRKASENITNTKASKKRKISATKKAKSKADSDDSNDDDSDSETASTESEESSDSSTQSLVSSKRKRKSKSKNASKAAVNLSNFSTNPVHLPMVLNGFPNLTVPLETVQNSTSSANTLNTLLLTQMFQNAIGSLKK